MRFTSYVGADVSPVPLTGARPVLRAVARQGRPRRVSVSAVVHTGKGLTKLGPAQAWRPAPQWQAWKPTLMERQGRPLSPRRIRVRAGDPSCAANAGRACLRDRIGVQILTNNE